MLIINAELIHALAAKPHFEAKMVFNDRGAIFLPVVRQHRDCTAEGISYEDDYKGNALAAMLKPGRIEIRYHADFSPKQVGQIVAALLALPELQHMHNWIATYGGKPLDRAC